MDLVTPELRRFQMNRHTCFLLFFCAITIASTACGGRRVTIATSRAVASISDWRKAVAAEIAESLTGAPATPEEKRNKAVSLSEALVVARYGKIRENLARGRALSAVAFDVLNIGLTGAVPIVNGTRGKTILGSLATGFQGIQGSIDKNVFQEQTTGALLSAMDACIIRQRAALEERRTLPVLRYDEYRAYADLVQLYGCTTLAGMVQELTETQAAETRSIKQVLRPVTPGDLATFQSIQLGFIRSLDSDSKAAQKFLELLKVQGLSAAPGRQELIAAYQGLLAAAATDDEFRQTMRRAASNAGLITNTN